MLKKIMEHEIMKHDTDNYIQISKAAMLSVVLVTCDCHCTYYIIIICAATVGNIHRLSQYLFKLGFSRQSPV